MAQVAIYGCIEPWRAAESGPPWGNLKQTKSLSPFGLLVCSEAVRASVCLALVSGHSALRLR